jgi:hypothetical protein
MVKIKKGDDGMAQFFNDYGSWLLIGGLFFLMMRMHGGGGCCGGGHHQQRKEETGKPNAHEYTGHKH